MAVVVDVLKLTQTQGVVAVRGDDATGTIALATTLKKSTETQSSPKANIRGIQWTLANSTAATVQRNSVVLYRLTESGSLDFNGFSDADENASDVEVVLAGGNGGTVIVNLAKVDGYGSQQHQDADGDLG
tara:strand:- start:5232 stop:5621 length:390 start_codon:yes stop_codon:yes gene_type:complete